MCQYHQIVPSVYYSATLIHSIIVQTLVCVLVPVSALVGWWDILVGASIVWLANRLTIFRCVCVCVCVCVLCCVRVCCVVCVCVVLCACVCVCFVRVCGVCVVCVYWRI